MELSVRLTNLKKKVMKKIADAALAHDTRLISKHSHLATLIEEDEKALEAMEERVNGYEKDLNDLSSSTEEVEIDWSAEVAKARAEAHRDSSRMRKSKGRQMGHEARMLFVSAGRKLGYSLIPLGGNLYTTPKEKKVVIAFANEHKPNRWFLGVQDDNYDAVVLLCQQSTGRMLEFILPREALGKFWTSLSRSGGQVKFNITRSGENSWLLVPGRAQESLNRHLGAYTALKD